MTPTIDCFAPNMGIQYSDTLRHALADSPIARIYPIVMEAEEIAPFIPLERNISTSTLKTMATQCSTDYMLLYTHAGALQVGYRAIERMLRTAMESSADWVYSNYYVLRQGTTLAVPTNEYQEGSLRDDFDFGPLVLVRTEVVKQFVATSPDEMRHAGLYQLRLYISRTGRIVHINEYLYTKGELDTRTSGERQFDYVDPRNRQIQIEMERACTTHLKTLGVYVDHRTLQNIDTTAGDFPYEATVIIPVKNRVRTIGDAIRSVLSQKTDFRFNIIVVDNHSTDGTTESIINSQSSIIGCQLTHLIPERNDLGIGGCWDLAIRHDQCGRYAVQLDSDDLYSDEQTLQRIVHAILGCPFAVVYDARGQCF